MDSLLRAILLPHHWNTEISTTRTRGQSLLTVRMKNDFAVYILSGQITHTMTGFSSRLVHSPATLLLTSLRHKARSASCAIQSLSDPIHRPVTTHALLSKGDRLQYPWSRSSCKHRRIQQSCWKLLGMGEVHWDLELRVALSGKIKMGLFGFNSAWGLHRTFLLLAY